MFSPYTLTTIWGPGVHTKHIANTLSWSYTIIILTLFPLPSVCTQENNSLCTYRHIAKNLVLISTTHIYIYIYTHTIISELTPKRVCAPEVHLNRKVPHKVFVGTTSPSGLCNTFWYPLNTLGNQLTVQSCNKQNYCDRGGSEYWPTP